MPAFKEVILVSSSDYLVEAIFSGRCSFASDLHDGFHSSKVDPPSKAVLEKIIIRRRNFFLPVEETNTFHPLFLSRHEGQHIKTLCTKDMQLNYLLEA